jgi:hypothetical protein
MVVAIIVFEFAKLSGIHCCDWMLTLRDSCLCTVESQYWCLEYLCDVAICACYVIRMLRSIVTVCDFLEFIINAGKILTDTTTKRLSIEL